MGVSISRKEINFLENFGGKSVPEQDSILLANCMESINTDTELKDILNINRAYVRLIRGLCDLVARKKENICTIVQAELMESKMARAKLENYIK